MTAAAPRRKMVSTRLSTVSLREPASRTPKGPARTPATPMTAKAGKYTKPRDQAGRLSVPYPAEM